MRLAIRHALLGLAAGILLATANLARAQEQQLEDQGDWRFSLQGAYLYGSVDGYVQTPSGGEPGTTSKHRPKLDEIGISDASLYDISAIAAWRREEFYAGAQLIQMSGSDTLSQSLTSQAQTFPAGTHVSSDVDLDWYRFGYRHRFSLDDKGEWTLWPSAGVAVWDFHYRLKGGGGETADRSYVKLNALFGLEAEWRPNHGRFAINASVLATPPVSSWPEIYTEQLIASYRVVDNGRIDVDVFAGIAFEQQYYEDSQSVPNRVEADFGPMVIAGLQFRF